MVVLCAGLSDAGKRLGSGQSAAPGEPVRGPETPLGRDEHMGIPLACGVRQICP